jgi:hypothetical protein
MNQSRINEYFTKLRNKIDLLVERFIHESKLDQLTVDRILLARVEWIDETQECEAFNLTHCPSDNEDQEMPQLDECELLKRFCFVFQVHVATSDRFSWRFMSTDKYVSTEKIKSNTFERYWDLLQSLRTRCCLLRVAFFNKSFKRAKKTQ